MDFAFTAEQNLIRETARVFCDANAPSTRVRAAMKTPLGYDPAVWEQMAAEMGWAAIAIPERFGGAGQGPVELGILQHEQGRRLLPSPFFCTVCLATPIITTLATEPQQAHLLERIASGKARMAVALTGPRGTPGCAGVTAELSRHGNRYRLQGESSFVIYGHACDMLLIAARAPGTEGARGVSVVAVEPDRPGIRVEKQNMLDLTRPMSKMTFDLDVGIESVLGEPEAAGPGLEQALQHARIALACEAVGGAEWTLEMTTAYVRQRVQFGRPIGSFQAIKHRLADMMVLLESARSGAWYAACAAGECPEELAQAAAIAKSASADAFYNCAANAIQLHGGIGFTWEHDAHLYFKRARASSTLLGSPAWQREQLARLMGLGEAMLPAF
jgi:alkylation response protein AidB-like acyl-CoA dehydrogenase